LAASSSPDKFIQEVRELNFPSNERSRKRQLSRLILLALAMKRQASISHYFPPLELVPSQSSGSQLPQEKERYDITN